MSPVRSHNEPGFFEAQALLGMGNTQSTPREGPSRARPRLLWCCSTIRCRCSGGEAGAWPRVYRKLRTKLDWFEHLARAYREMPASPLLLEVLPRFKAQADEAIRMLEASAYRKLAARGEEAWGLAHQDYGWSNGQVGPDGKVWIIDLDGVAFDLAFRDLRKLITGTMDDRGDWDLTWMKAMIRAYHEVHPIEPEAMQVMLIDMYLPTSSTSW